MGARRLDSLFGVLDERRGFARVPLGVGVTIWSASRHAQLVASDISEGGISVLVDPDAPFPHGTEVMMSLAVNGRMVGALGRVRWTRGPRGGAVSMGIEFEPLNEADRAIVAGHCARRALA